MALTAQTVPRQTTQTTDTVTESTVKIENTTPTPDVTYLDYKATINAAARLTTRIRVTREWNGNKVRNKVEELWFYTAADQTYSDAATTPFTDAEADEVFVIGYGPYRDFNAFMTAAGDTTGT